MKTITCSVMVVAFALVSAANGQEFLSDPSQFSVPTKLLDFETSPDGNRVRSFSFIHSGTWTNAGVLMNRGVWALPWEYYAHLAPHSGGVALSGNTEYNVRGGVISFNFVLPGTTSPVAMTEAGIWVQHYVPPFPSTSRPKPIIGFVDVNGVEIGVFVARKKDEFFGMRHSSGISRIYVTFSGALPDTGFFNVDDLQFGPVPPPTVSTERVRPAKIVAKWHAYYGAYKLQVTHHRNRRNSEETIWRDVAAQGMLMGDTYCVTNHIADGRYFRVVPR